MVEKPIILVGLYGRRDMIGDVAQAILEELGDESLAYRVAREDNVIHFDMSTLPERGDALDHFDKGSLVIAHHLYYDDWAPSGMRDYFYNRSNNRIIEAADQAGVPLLIFGDYPNRGRQPDRKYRSFRLYLPR